MAAPPRHAKPRKSVARRWAPGAAAVTLAGAATAFMTIPGGPATAGSRHDAAALTGAGAVTGPVSDVTVGQMNASVHRNVAVLQSRRIQEANRAAQRRRAAAARAARAAAAQAARQAAAAARQAASQPASPSPSASPTAAATPPPVSGGNAASSALGVCIRNAEEGGSYAWGPGNGGGAYQFVLGTWETYGGAASEYGVACPAYQDQIFDNAIAAGGASNWTNYDGC